MARRMDALQSAILQMAPSVAASSCVPLADFGRDHWSALAYIETRCVDAHGRIDKEKMRCDVDRHPAQAHALSVLTRGTKYPTRLRGGRLLDDHDDWDCLDDMAAAGILELTGTGLEPIARLTEFGAGIASQLRIALHNRRNTGSVYDSFVPRIEASK